MPALSRVGDLGESTCPDHDSYTTEYITGASTVFTNELAQTYIGTVGDQTCTHSSEALTGSPTVFAENIPVHRVGDVGEGGAGDIYESITGSPNVFNDDGAGGQGGVPAQNMPMTPAVASYYANQISNKPGISKYITATHDTDDEGAPSDQGGVVLYSEKQTQVKAASVIEGVDINTPQPTVAVATVTPPPPLSASGYNYTDINAQALPFPGNFPLSPNYTLAQLTTNTRVSNYTLKAQHGLTEKQIVSNLRDLCYNIIEPLRVQYPNILINSGFRTSSPPGKSQHERGMAVDLFIPTATTNAAGFPIATAIANSSLPYDQFIFEQQNQIWYHVSYDRSKPSQRRMVMTKSRSESSPTVGLRQVQ